MDRRIRIIETEDEIRLVASGHSESLINEFEEAEAEINGGICKED